MKLRAAGEGKYACSHAPMQASMHTSRQQSS